MTYTFTGVIVAFAIAETGVYFVTITTATIPIVRLFVSRGACAFYVISCRVNLTFTVSRTRDLNGRFSRAFPLASWRARGNVRRIARTEGVVVFGSFEFYFLGDTIVITTTVSKAGFPFECNGIDTRADDLTLGLVPESFFTETLWLIVYYLTDGILSTDWVTILIDTGFYTLNTFFVIKVTVCAYAFTFCVTGSVTVTSVAYTVVR